MTFYLSILLPQSLVQRTNVKSVELLQIFSVGSFESMPVEEDELLVFAFPVNPFKHLDCFFLVQILVKGHVEAAIVKLLNFIHVPLKLRVLFVFFDNVAIAIQLHILL